MIGKSKIFQKSGFLFEYYFMTNKVLTKHVCFSSVAPFNSMQDRKNQGVVDNPGPGDYASEKVKVVATVKDMMSNSFTTKESSPSVQLL